MGHVVLEEGESERFQTSGVTKPAKPGFGIKHGNTVTFALSLSTASPCVCTPVRTIIGKSSGRAMVEAEGRLL